jgi:hypothetical protein
MKDIEVKFPLIEDITMEVAKKYGMIQPGESNTKAVRAVFFIDPKGIIRAMIYYPLSLGRNFDEIYRSLVALQVADKYGVALPADWRPGDDVIVPPAGSCGVAKERMDGVADIKCHDWFFCTKKISEEQINNDIYKKVVIVGSEMKKIIDFVRKHLMKILLFLVLSGATCPCCGANMFACANSVSLIGLMGTILVVLKKMVWFRIRRWFSSV